MPRGWFRRLAALSAICAVLLVGSAAGAQQVQPGYDVIRVSGDDGVAIPYVVWVAWTPTIVTTPDGGAWAFFSAQPAGTEGAGNRGVLYATRFDPATGVWQPARRMPGGEIQFGASAVVDGEGRVHVVYSNRTLTTPEGSDQEILNFSTLVYTVSDGNGGWSEPVPVAPNDTAGHQLSPQLAIDGSGGLHVAWQDQRNMTDEQRGNNTEEQPGNAAYADVFVSDFVDGEWSNPVQVSKRTDPEMNGSRPQLVADGDRLVAAWSIYQGVSQEALASAIRVEWSTRALDPAATWAEAKPLLERENDQIGGRLVDLATKPGGGVMALYGRRTEQGDANNRTVSNDLYLRQLDSGANDWGEQLAISTGEKGAYPVLAIAPDGIVYAIYENGSGDQVDVGGLALAPDATTPGPAAVVSPGEAGAQGRPSVTVDQNGRVWVIYFHQPRPEDGAVEVRVLRGAQIPAQAA